MESVDKQLAALREGDEQVASALAGLDAKLEQWLEAMREGQAAVVNGLADGARAAAVDAVEEAAAIAAFAKEAATPEDVTAAETAAEAETAVAEEELSAAAETESVEAAASVETAEEAAPETETIEASAAETVEEPPPVSTHPVGMFQKPVRPTEDAASASAAEKEPEDEMDDEALLASLDEETAAAIRVKRRLCNNQRSVRDLLEELRREKPAQEKKTQPKKSWWR